MGSSPWAAARTAATSSSAGPPPRAPIGALTERPRARRSAALGPTQRRGQGHPPSRVRAMSAVSGARAVAVTPTNGPSRRNVGAYLGGCRTNLVEAGEPGSGSATGARQEPDISARRAAIEVMRNDRDDLDASRPSTRDPLLLGREPADAPTGPSPR